MAVPEDQVSRFAVDDSYFRADNSVKHRAFTPARDGCTSVFLISGMTHAECIAHGTEHVASARGKPIRGYVRVQAKFIFAECLSIEDDIPPPRHANILNWKADIDAAKLQSMSIAEEAEYVPA